MKQGVTKTPEMVGPKEMARHKGLFSTQEDESTESFYIFQ